MSKLNDQRTPDYQQRLVLQQKYNLLDSLDRANEVLDQKTVQILQIGVFLVILSGILSISDYSIKDPLVNKGLLVISLTVFLVTIVVLLNTILSPVERKFPGSINWDEIYTDYISANPEDCFNQVLSDLLEAIKNERSVNDKKAKYVKLSIILLILQIVSLLTIILWF